MARETGLEPAASAVTGRRSNQLSYSRNPGQARRDNPACVTQHRIGCCAPQVKRARAVADNPGLILPVGSDVEVRDEGGALLDEAETGLRLRSHKCRHGLGKHTLVAVTDLDLKEKAARRVHGR